MRVEKKPKAFAYKVPIGDYNYCYTFECIGWNILSSLNDAISTNQIYNMSHGL